ncbi:probable E3 ubiquitin-protein ligase rbrA isoform X2 [Jatropha curcas]|uniref:probable E3 ubiquitin-protein ligase rbrA isoform X2 n=1 Tax=Jatropha curcas TaxID=180498 RepID=UPI0005FAC479|nr:probable E3 ubiquitin-protein ligase rbrA isoform X2 [Jatropha curcas]
MATTNTHAASDDDLPSLLSEQRRELMAAQSLESDLDLAFRLQLQEAINASLSLVPSSSTSPPQSSPSILIVSDQDSNVSASLPSLQTEEISKLEQELNDRKQSELEMRRIREDLDRRMHDQRVAREISMIPDDEWLEWGDDFEKPFGEGSSRSMGNDDSVFKLYFKGLVSEENVGGKKVILAGIGVAICDPVGNLVFEIRKPLVGNGMSRQAAEAKALIEGLNAALALELKRISIYCDYYPLYKFIIGRWPPKQRKVATLVNQVSLIQRKFTYCIPTLVARNDIKHAFKLARDAIVSQTTTPAGSSHGKRVQETCVICLEDTDVERMFSVDGCRHRYCFSCMKQHVEVKLLHGMVPKCPHEGCKSELRVNCCGKFLTPKLLETLNQRIEEASIPVTEKVYCPYPKCSALMSKNEVSEYAKSALVGSDRSGARKCLKCHGLFCINCKVPWHSNMTCIVYKMRHPNPHAEDAKLKSLASRNQWRQCVKCNHMIELAEGCYHMTCRCGFQFCYVCGAEWKDKKPTCSCRLWDEDNILHDDDEEEEEEELSDDDEYYDSDEDHPW